MKCAYFYPFSNLHSIYPWFSGKHEYKFFIDGKWVVDDTQPKTGNNLGGENNVIFIDEADFEVGIILFTQIMFFFHLRCSMLWTRTWLLRMQEKWCEDHPTRSPVTTLLMTGWTWNRSTQFFFVKIHTLRKMISCSSLEEWCWKERALSNDEF